MQYAGVGRRFVAWIIDLVLLLVALYVLALLTGNTTEGSDTFILNEEGELVRDEDGGIGFKFTGLGALLALVFAFGYYIVLEALLAGTPGKLATGLRVLKDDGTRLDWPAAVVRNVMRIVDSIPFLIPYLVGAIAVWTSSKKQRLGDRVAGTVVVRKGSAAAAVTAAPRDPSPS